MYKIIFYLLMFFSATSTFGKSVSLFYNPNAWWSNIHANWPLEQARNDVKSLLAIYDYDYIDNINQLNDEKLQIGKSILPAWSYHPFPTFKGGIANRYLLSNFRTQNDWKNLFSIYQHKMPGKLIAQGRTENLSPIEKYEYFVGNTNFSLTSAQWKEGEEALKIYGEVPQWHGACHGTAPASIRSARPTNVVKVKSYDGKDDIVFYPSDIKALLSFAWAHSGGQAEVIGTRCNQDLTNSLRQSSASCNDVNPGSFHLAMVNLLGRKGEPFILDVAAGKEIWNKTIVAYKYEYYLPSTRKRTNILSEAIIARDKYFNDPFQKYRSKNSTHLVGINLELTIVSAIEPSAAKVNSEKKDAYYKINLRYDLELDESGKVIGGEWSNSSHPDFLWVVAPHAKPLSANDYSLQDYNVDFDGSQPLPQRVQELAIVTSQKNQVLYWVLEKLLEISNNAELH